MPQPISKEQQKELIKLGEKIRAIREEKGLTLQQVADEIGKDRQSIHRAEKGDFNPGYLFLMDLCRGLKIDIIKLFQ